MHFLQVFHRPPEATRAYLMYRFHLCSYIYHFLFLDAFNKCKNIRYTETERASAAMWAAKRFNCFLFIHRSANRNGVKVNCSWKAIEVTFKRYTHLIKTGKIDVRWRSKVKY